MDDNVFSVYTRWQKRFMIVAVSLFALLATMATSMYYPALPTVATDLGVTITEINLSVTTFMILQGIAPTFVGSFSDASGRRLAYIACFVIFLVANIALALQNTYGGLLALRCVQSAGAGGLIPLASGVIADIVEPSERGAYMAWATVAPVLGPALAPVLGGILTQYLGWHSIFWFLAIADLVLGLLFLFFFPETNRKLVGNGSRFPPKLSRPLWSCFQRRGKQHEESIERKPMRLPNPFSILKIALDKEGAVVLAGNGLINVLIAGVMTGLSQLMTSLYGLSQLQSSLCFLAFGVGSAVNTIITGRLLDRAYRNTAAKHNIPIKMARRDPNMPVEKARLQVTWPHLGAAVAGLIGYGWTLNKPTHLAGPMVFLFVIGYTTTAVAQALNALMVDLFPQDAATASAANNLIRCGLGAAITAAIQPLTDAVHPGWTYTICAAFLLLIVPFFAALIRFGPAWRLSRSERGTSDKGVESSVVQITNNLMMKEQDLIVSFWQTTQRLLQDAASNGKEANDFDLDTWIKRYETLVEQFANGNTQGLVIVGEARICWKVSQDILIRLRRLHANPQDTQQGCVIFTEPDKEALDRRLLDIQQRLNIASDTVPDNTDRDVSVLADTLSGVQVNASKPMTVSDRAHEVQGDTGRETDTPGSQNPPPGLNEGLLQDFILESLSFKSMDFREQDIEQAHGTSFDWIFRDKPEDSHPSFSEWLSTTKLGNIYWITGKPGSGKSTLLRYLSRHKKTMRLLHAWAGNPHVIMAGFYFWTSGSQEQRSQTGLLRSLLFQLLSKRPDLISLALPQLWQKLASMTSKERVATTIEWSTSELMDGFSTFLHHGLSETKLCLFVDGLDEFDGDHEAIIHFFRRLAEGDQGSQIKMCLSSRPWAVFERVFEYAVPNLKLQASNFQDMMRYTIDKLSKHENLRSVMMQEVDLARKMVQETVEMASGVFLWVRLAVGELIRRFDHAEAKIADMQNYVSSLPTELDSLFEVLVFDNQSRERQAETSRLFQLVRAREMVADFIQDDSATSLSLWELAFAINGSDDDLVALERDVQQEAEPEAAQRCAETRSWALSRSVGLLEVHHRSGRGSNRQGSSVEELAQNRVTYLHRTVHDWVILSPGDRVWHRLRDAGEVAETDLFDPHLRLLRSYILQMKHPLEEPEHHRRLDEWYPGIALALTHARYVERDPEKLQVRLIGEVEKTISWYWVSRGPPAIDHWARNSFGTYEERQGNKLVIPHAYLALCTRFGLEHYVIDRLDRMATEPPKSDDEEHDLDTESEGHITEETPLLYRALEFLCSRQKTIYPFSSLSFVHALLEASERYASHPTLSSLIGSLNAPSWSSPLLKKKQVTTWTMVLRHLRDAKRRDWIERFDVDVAGTERWTSIVECLIQRGGADRHAVVLRDSWDPETSAKGVLGRGGLLDEFGDFWVEERLVPLFEDVAGAALAPDVAGSPGGKRTRLEHILALPT